MIRIRSLLSIVISFFASLLGRPQPVPAVTAMAVENRSIERPRLSDKRRRRLELRSTLGRVDGGGKHYGSKRPLRQKKYGKRSGQQ